MSWTSSCCPSGGERSQVGGRVQRIHERRAGTSARTATRIWHGMGCRPTCQGVISAGARAHGAVITCPRRVAEAALNLRRIPHLLIRRFPMRHAFLPVEPVVVRVTVPVEGRVVLHSQTLSVAAALHAIRRRAVQALTSLSDEAGEALASAGIPVADACARAFRVLMPQVHTDRRRRPG